MKPLCIDLFCGLGGWAEGFLAEGWRVIGFDIERHDYGTGGYPGELVIQDCLTLHGSQFKDADCLVFSPPCQNYSYMAMPWSRAKAMAARYRENIGDLNALFNACFRIQLEASQAAGHHIPLVVENVKGAQPWVGPAKAHFGSFYLWGDVESVGGRVVVRPEFGQSVSAARRERKVASAYAGPGSWKTVDGLDWRAPENCGVKQGGSGAAWFDAALDERRKAATAQRQELVSGVSPETHEAEGRKGLDGKSWIRDKSKDPRPSHGNSNSRKAASAMIAKIPFGLSSFIARSFYPREKAIPDVRMA
jgi:hypothetical protein